MKHTVRRFSVALALPLLAACLAAPLHAAERPPMKGGAGNAKVLSGGVGEDARSQLAAQARGYELKLVFAAASGAYLADVAVTVTDQAGRTVVDQVADGPWMFVDLPSGSYTVKAAVADRTETRRVSVKEGTQKTLQFRWPRSAEGIVVHEAGGGRPVEGAKSAAGTSQRPGSR